MDIKRSYISALLLVVAFCTSCNAQVKTNALADHSTVSTINGQPKLIKNHFTDKYQEAADNIHCGLQDKAGNLWFGTTGDGVYRYDGKSFTNFTIKDGLDANQILSILEDNTGNIWFGSRSGLCRYDGKTITKISITTSNDINFLPSVSLAPNSYTKNAVWGMMKDKSGTLWFGTDEGVYCFDGKTFRRFLDNPNIINESKLTLKSVQCMLEDAKGNIWFGSGPMAFEGICFYDGKNLTSYKPQNQQWVRKIIERKNGSLLFATRAAGILSYDISAEQSEAKTFINFPAPPEFLNGSLTSILENHSGLVLMAADYGNNPGDTLGGLWYSGLSIDNTAKKTFTKITNREVFFILEDKDNNLWLGTRGTDLYRYDGKTFTRFSE